MTVQHDNHNENEMERELAETMKALDPPDYRIAQMEERVLDAWDKVPERRTLLGEWLDVFGARPILYPTFALAGSAALVLVTPVSGILLTLMLSQS